MGAQQRIRMRRQRRRINKAFDLQLTSMLDVLVILLVFMLKSMSASTTHFSTVPGIKIPISKSHDLPADSAHLIITPEAMTFEDLRILDFQQTAGSIGNDDASYRFNSKDLDEGGRRVVPLYEALIKARRQSETLLAKSSARDANGRPLPFVGVLAIQADKRVSYDTLRRVMYTAAAAGYQVFRFLAIRPE